MLRLLFCMFRMHCCVFVNIVTVSAVAYVCVVFVGLHVSILSAKMCFHFKSGTWSLRVVSLCSLVCMHCTLYPFSHLIFIYKYLRQLRHSDWSRGYHVAGFKRMIKHRPGLFKPGWWWKWPLNQHTKFMPRCHYIAFLSRMMYLISKS